MTYSMAAWALPAAGVQRQRTVDVVGRWRLEQEMVSAKLLNTPKLLRVSNNQVLA